MLQFRESYLPCLVGSTVLPSVPRGVLPLALAEAHFLPIPPSPRINCLVIFSGAVGGAFFVYVEQSGNIWRVFVFVSLLFSSIRQFLFIIIHSVMYPLVLHSFPVIVSFSARVFPCDVSVFLFGSEPTRTPVSTSSHASGDFVFLGFRKVSFLFSFT